MPVSVDLVLICFSSFSTVQNQTQSSGTASPNVGLEAVRNPPPQNWPQVPNQPQQRPVPPPGGGQPVAQDINPTQGSQRALAWTGHLEWQDTVSWFIKIKNEKNSSINKVYVMLCYVKDHYTFLRNCPPTPPLSQYYHILLT